MERLPIGSNAVYCYYYPLLQRYARRMVKGEAVAAMLAREVLEAEYLANGLLAHEGLRQLLRMAIHYRCHYWIQAEVFDRAPVDSRKCSR